MKTIYVVTTSAHGAGSRNEFSSFTEAQKFIAYLFRNGTKNVHFSKE